MATATKVTRQVEITTTRGEERIILELNSDETRTLMDILCEISGSPTESRRGYVDNMREELIGVGIYYDFDRGNDIKGDLRFLDTEV